MPPFPHDYPEVHIDAILTSEATEDEDIININTIFSAPRFIVSTWALILDKINYHVTCIYIS